MKTLAPSGWSDEERQQFWDIQQSWLPGNPVAKGSCGAVTTALNGLAARAGEEALRQGGSATDAVMTGALAQIVLGGGAVISFFGILAMIHYDSAGGEITSLNAGWNTCREEDDPLSIPGTLNPGGEGTANMLGSGAPSGRTALVGGFMRGLEEAHKRFGKLPFARLFEPAIELAESGFCVSSGLARYINIRKAELTRLPETCAVFFKPDGEPYGEGDHFCQPALAETLRNVARNGADYMYCGAWAARCVSAVQADGGRMTADDLSSYRPMWSDPVLVDRGQATLALLGAPCEGSVNLIESLNLCDVAGVSSGEHWSRSADKLVRLAKCCAATGLYRFAPADEQEAAFPGIDFDQSSRTSIHHAEKMWNRIAEDSPIHFTRSGIHSDNVVAIDRWGNMAGLCHSINCLIWGRTAIVVDGVFDWRSGSLSASTGRIDAARHTTR